MSTVEYKNLRFIILDCPHENNLGQYLEEFKNRGVTDVVRVCEPTYNTALFEENGIKVHDWPFRDGGVPPQKIITSWLTLCDEKFGGIKAKDDAVVGNGPVIAVHCVAGLGRAPILVAMTLIEAGMEPLDTVEFIRRRRRGALNSVQLQYLVDTYKRQWNKKGGSKLSLFVNKRSSSPAHSVTSVSSAYSVKHSKSMEVEKSVMMDGEKSGSEGELKAEMEGESAEAGGVSLFGKIFRFGRKTQPSQQPVSASG
ncbi:hypothetical protein HK098_006264 [Nowakowskiella sp. JEL0407]|nr:hypothetical protein HK098_006264 [Nowakowskiella sp. JEL0407]